MTMDYKTFTNNLKSGKLSGDTMLNSLQYVSIFKTQESKDYLTRELTNTGEHILSDRDVWWNNANSEAILNLINNEIFINEFAIPPIIDSDEYFFLLCKICENICGEKDLITPAFYIKTIVLNGPLSPQSKRIFKNLDIKQQIYCTKMLMETLIESQNTQQPPTVETFEGVMNIFTDSIMKKGIKLQSLEVHEIFDVVYNMPNFKETESMPRWFSEVNLHSVLYQIVSKNFLPLNLLDEAAQGFMIVLNTKMLSEKPDKQNSYLLEFFNNTERSKAQHLPFLQKYLEHHNQDIVFITNIICNWNYNIEDLDKNTCQNISSFFVSLAAKPIVFPSDTTILLPEIKYGSLKKELASSFNLLRGNIIKNNRHKIPTQALTIEELVQFGTKNEIEDFLNKSLNYRNTPQLWLIMNLFADAIIKHTMFIPKEWSEKIIDKIYNKETSITCGRLNSMSGAPGVELLTPRKNIDTELTI